MRLRELEIKDIQGITGNESEGYTIQENKKFSQIVPGDEIIIAFSKKRKKIVIYNKDLEIISKADSYKFTVHKYELKNIVFWTFGTNKIMFYYKGEVVWIDIPYETKDFFKFAYIKNMFYVEKKFFVECEYCWSDRDLIISKIAFFEIKPKEKELRKILEIDSRKIDFYFIHNNEYSSRFLTRAKYGIIYDLFTGQTYVMETSEIKSKEDLQVCYSSKEIIIIKNLNSMKYYLYIKGECVYEYDYEEQKKVMFDLKENWTVGKNFSTLPVGNNLCIWSKEVKPELISLIFKK